MHEPKPPPATWVETVVEISRLAEEARGGDLSALARWRELTGRTDVNHPREVPEATVRWLR